MGGGDFYHRFLAGFLDTLHTSPCYSHTALGLAGLHLLEDNIIEGRGREEVPVPLLSDGGQQQHRCGNYVAHTLACLPACQSVSSAKPVCLSCLRPCLHVACLPACFPPLAPVCLPAPPCMISGASQPGSSATLLPGPAQHQQRAPDQRTAGKVPDLPDSIR